MFNTSKLVCLRCHVLKTAGWCVKPFWCNTEDRRTDRIAISVSHNKNNLLIMRPQTTYSSVWRGRAKEVYWVKGSRWDERRERKRWRSYGSDDFFQDARYALLSGHLAGFSSRRTKHWWSIVVQFSADVLETL